MGSQGQNACIDQGPLDAERFCMALVPSVQCPEDRVSQRQKAEHPFHPTPFALLGRPKGLPKTEDRESV